MGRGIDDNATGAGSDPEEAEEEEEEGRWEGVVDDYNKGAPHRWE